MCSIVMVNYTVSIMLVLQDSVSFRIEEYRNIKQSETWKRTLPWLLHYNFLDLFIFQLCLKICQLSYFSSLQMHNVFFEMIVIDAQTDTLSQKLMDPISDFLKQMHPMKQLYSIMLLTVACWTSPDHRLKLSYNRTSLTLCDPQEWDPSGERLGLPKKQQQEGEQLFIF